MNKTTSKIMKSMAIGMGVGVATYMMSNTKSKSSKVIKKNTDKAIRAVGSVIDNVTSMIG